MIIINYDSTPNKSIYYMSALLYKYIRKTCDDFEEVYKFFINNINKNDLMFYYSLDWLFLIGKIKGIVSGKIICD